MRKKIQNFILLHLYLIFGNLHAALGQNEDTVLNTILSSPYFYNIIQLDQNKVYAGTSEGILEINNLTLRQTDSRIGYITSTKDGIPTIDSTGIFYYEEKKYLHLLPYPEIAREEFHASQGKKFYISSGGRLYIFDIVPYKLKYPFHSVRSISRDLVGTYSGIYLRGKKLLPPGPEYTDGYIRQFDNRAFICNYGLYVLEKDAIETGELKLGNNYFIYNFKDSKFINDIIQSPDDQYYLIATDNNLIRTDRNFRNDTTLFAHKHKNAPIVFIREDQYSLYFTANNELHQYNFGNGLITKVCTLPNKILGGVASNQQTFLITYNGLYRCKSDLTTEKIVNIEKSHSIIEISGSELLISSDNGLFLFNSFSKTLSTVIKGVEFNRQALYQEGDIIYAGSLNGLFSFKTSDIPALIKINKSEIKDKNQIRNLLFIGILFLVIIITAIIIVTRYYKKLKKAEETIETLQTPRESISREKIEAYIQNNLPSASLKTLMDHFKVSAPVIYEELKPDRPGSIIQQLRLKTVIEMREDKKTIEEISEATGLSISYLKKIKN